MKIVNQLFIVFLLLITSSISIAKIRYLHTDMMGSVISVSDEQGNIISRNHYDPFGKRIGGEKEGIGYTGHLQDTDLGLTYMQARYYDPLIGRFYSNDPVGFTGAPHSFNRYAYVANNPYKYVDPDGRELVSAISLTADVKELGSGAISKAEFVNRAQTRLEAAEFASEFIPIGRVIKAGKIATRTCCFVAGTQVLTENGYKNIEDVKLGEKLWAKNTETGEQDWKPVTKVFVEPDRGIFEVTLLGEDAFEQKIQATDDHPFYVIGKGWKQTIELEVGDLIETDGHGSMKVVSVKDEQRTDLTYNFTVADFHTYYVTKKNVLVHNCNKTRSTRPSPLKEAEGRPHSIIEKSGRNGQYTTHNADGTFKQYRGSGKPHGGIPRPNVKTNEGNVNTNPKTGESFPGKTEVRPPKPDEIPKG